MVRFHSGEGCSAGESRIDDYEIAKDWTFSHIIFPFGTKIVRIATVTFIGL